MTVPTIADIAVNATLCGLSVIPIAPDNTKKPSTPEWKSAMEAIWPEDRIRKEFKKATWLGVVAGKASGDLEAIDFDDRDLYPAWRKVLEENGYEGLLRRLLVQSTKRGGFHVVYRCPGAVEGNQKLATQKDKPHGGIETRGIGGYICAVPTPDYKVIQGSFARVPEITPDEREMLLVAARMFDEAVDPPTVKERPERFVTSAKRPGDNFNLRANWQDILEGWLQKGRSTGNRMCWVRPGKDPKDGWGATTSGDDLILTVHTSNAPPFVAGKSYSKFGAYTLLKFNGDYHIAAQSLAKDGYSERVRSTSQQRTAEPTTNELTTRGLETEGWSEDDEFEPVTLEYRVWPFMPVGKCVLFDADGGTGKTSLMIAWAAALSRGQNPLTHEVCDAVKTLYVHAREDQNEEIETVYRGNGGRPGMFRYYSKPFVLDEIGSELLRETIDRDGFQVVVLDALFYFLPPTVQSTNDNLTVMPVLQRLNDLASSTGASIVNIRHITKGTADRDASNLGLGSVQFRNSHRGQMLARWHPDRYSFPRVVVVTDEKGGLMKERGPTFGFRREGLEVQYLENFTDPFDKNATEVNDVTRVEAAKRLIRRVCYGQICSVTTLNKLAAEERISLASITRARKDLTESGELLHPIRLTDGWALRLSDYDPEADK